MLPDELRDTIRTLQGQVRTLQQRRAVLPEGAAPQVVAVGVASGFSDYTRYDASRYPLEAVVYPDGLVQVRGVVSADAAGAVVAGTILATVPPDAAPTRTEYYLCITSNGLDSVTIAPDGHIRYAGSSAGTTWSTGFSGVTSALILSGIAYLAG